MLLNRRTFVALAATSVASDLVVSSPRARAATILKVRAIAFEGLPIFDPRPVYALAGDTFPDKGAELGNAWRARQFEYTWLRTLTGDYVDFLHVTEDALVYAAKLIKIEVTVGKRNQLMQAFLSIRARPDALPTLQSLKSFVIKMVLLSNFTPRNVRCCGLELRTARYFRTAPQYRQG